MEELPVQLTLPGCLLGRRLWTTNYVTAGCVAGHVTCHVTCYIPGYVVDYMAGDITGYVVADVVIVNVIGQLNVAKVGKRQSV